VRTLPLFHRLVGILCMPVAAVLVLLELLVPPPAHRLLTLMTQMSMKRLRLRLGQGCHQLEGAGACENDPRCPAFFEFHPTLPPRGRFNTDTATGTCAQLVAHDPA